VQSSLFVLRKKFGFLALKKARAKYTWNGFEFFSWRKHQLVYTNDKSLPPSLLFIERSGFSMLYFSFPRLAFSNPVLLIPFGTVLLLLFASSIIWLTTCLLAGVGGNKCSRFNSPSSLFRFKFLNAVSELSPAISDRNWDQDTVAISRYLVILSPQEDQLVQRISQMQTVRWEGPANLQTVYECLLSFSTTNPRSFPTDPVKLEISFEMRPHLQQQDRKPHHLSSWNTTWW